MTPMWKGDHLPISVSSAANNLRAEAEHQSTFPSNRGTKQDYSMTSMCQGDHLPISVSSVANNFRTEAERRSTFPSTSVMHQDYSMMSMWKVNHLPIFVSPVQTIFVQLQSIRVLSHRIKAQSKIIQ